MTVTNIREQLIRDEGEKLDAYRDTEGLLTIGIGRCIDRVPFTPDEAEICGCVGWTDYSNLTITEEASSCLFENDIQKFDFQLLQALPWTAQLDEARYGVLLNMAFNMGVGSSQNGTGLCGFKKFLAAMRRHDWTTAGIEMMDSTWATQVGDRAKRLRQQVETGLWV